MCEKIFYYNWRVHPVQIFSPSYGMVTIMVLIASNHAMESNATSWDWMFSPSLDEVSSMYDLDFFALGRLTSKHSGLLDRFLQGLNIKVFPFAGPLRNLTSVPLVALFFWINIFRAMSWANFLVHFSWGMLWYMYSIYIYIVIYVAFWWRHASMVLWACIYVCMYVRTYVCMYVCIVKIKWKNLGMKQL